MLTHNFCVLHFVQVPQLCGHLAVIAGHGHTILPVLLIEICLIFFDQRHTLGHAVTARSGSAGVLNAKSKSWPMVVEATCRRVSLAA